jgi:hypothetical protein
MDGDEGSMNVAFIASVTGMITALNAGGSAWRMTIEASCQSNKTVYGMREMAEGKGRYGYSNVLDTLRPLLIGLFPALSASEFAVHTAGYDCIAVEVDNRFIFKFPRHTRAEDALIVEAGVLTIIRTAVTMPVPTLVLFPGPPAFSRHLKLAGEHLLTPQYRQLPTHAQQRLASDMALFYAELHDLDVGRMEAAGARPLTPWLGPDDVLRQGWPVLTPDLRLYAERTLAEWQLLPPDPYGVIYGFFDGHGKNMAFDHQENRLNGMYDFGDAGFGPVHQEFIYSNWIEPNLTARIVTQYEALTGRNLDRRRIDLLSGVLRLKELAEAVDDPSEVTRKIETVAEWVGRKI